MMLMTSIEPPAPRSSHRIVRLFRRWAAGAELGPARLPAVVRLCRKIGIAPEAAIALASMFQLVEACLGRPLEAECCCSPSLSRDERALLMMLAAPLAAGPHRAFPAIPHGLPGALHWAIASVRALLGPTFGVQVPDVGKCPFEAGS